jgi:hypothetical protein
MFSACPYPQPQASEYDSQNVTNQGDPNTTTPTVFCIECGRPSSDNWHGWRAYRVEDLDTGERPEVGFYCPDCATREFDSPPAT